MLGIWKIASEFCSIHEGTKNNALSRIIRNAIYNLHTRKTMIILKLALKNLVIKVTPPFDLLLHASQRVLLLLKSYLKLPYKTTKWPQRKQLRVLNVHCTTIVHT